MEILRLFYGNSFLDALSVTNSYFIFHKTNAAGFALLAAFQNYHTANKGTTTAIGSCNAGNQFPIAAIGRCEAAKKFQTLLSDVAKQRTGFLQK